MTNRTVVTTDPRFSIPETRSLRASR